MGGSWSGSQFVKKISTLDKLDHVALSRPKMTGESLSSSLRTPVGPLRRPSPQTPRKPSSIGVDAAFPFDEPVQRLGIQLVLGSVTHHARPLAPSPFVGLDGVRGASNDDPCPAPLRPVYSASRIRATPPTPS